MKTSIKIASLALCLLWGIILSSCMEDDLVSSVDPASLGQPVTVNLDAASVLTTDEGDAADRVVSSFRALIYYAANGELAFNIPVDVPTPSRIDIRTGTYDFVFIANEDSDPALKAHLTSTDDADINTLSKLRALSFARSAFAANEDIPMVKFVEHVDVLGDNKIRIAQMTDIQTGVWTVAMQRVATRLKLSVTMTPDQYAEWATSPKITLTRVADKAFVLPGMDNSDYQNATGEEYTASATADAAPGLISAADVDGNVTITYDRLILPELFLAPTNNVEANVMKLSMAFGDKVKTGMMKAPDGDAFGYALPRNTFLKMDATVKVDKIDIQAEVLPWGDADMDIPFDGQYTLTVDQTDFYFNSYGNVQPINITTDYPGGWTVEAGTTAWTLLPTPTNNEVGAAAYSGSTARMGTFIIRAGNLRKTIHVIQFPLVSAVKDTIISSSYIGAFWKASQQGERLINIPTGAAAGKWTAIVAEGEEWIHLDTQMTSDPNVGWLPGANEAAVKNGNDPGFDNTYFVSGNYKYVTGTVDASNPGIYFRIGLNGAYTPSGDAPVRYGVVILSYANNTKRQRIWIRQGEGADYLMRNGDPVLGTTGITARTVARAFSPYNLTAATLNATVSRNGDTSTGEQPGIPTDYPTQVGALWMWASKANPRYAWDPFSPTVTGWTNEDYASGYWNTLAADHETCPSGYRRPTNGRTDVGTGTPLTLIDANLSELMQSLFETPNFGYSAFEGNMSNYKQGYYADGFFDRRLIVDDPTQPQPDETKAVAISTRNVANSGGLFYNNATNASLYFPEVGFRNAQYYGEFGPGTADVHYWTSSTSSTGIGWAYRGYPRAGSGLAIRCVKDE